MEGHKLNLSSLLFNANIKIQDVVIEFVSKRGGKFYAGWSGMSSSELKTLEIDSVFAQSLNLQDREDVTVNLKVKNYVTTHINLEPVSSSDWEVVELNAQAIEDRLLSQTRCVSQNQSLLVYPNQTTYAKLIVTDIGTKDHDYALISPFCEIAIAPKVRVRKSSAPKTQKSVKASVEDYSNMQSILKRGISLPHEIFETLPAVAKKEGYEVYISNEEKGLTSEYVAVSIIPGPNSKTNGGSTKQLPQTDDNSNNDSLIKESNRIVAKVVYDRGCPSDTVGLSRKLAVALNVESSVGSIVVLKHAVNDVKKKSSLILHPYITQTKKVNQFNMNSSEEKKSKMSLAEGVSLTLFDTMGTPISNFMKIPIVEGLLPNGGLLEFKKNDDPNAWMKLSDKKRPPKIEVGTELIRPISFIETPIAKESEEINEAIGLGHLVEDILETVKLSPNSGILVHGNSGSGKTLLSKLVEKEAHDKFGDYVKFVSCEAVMNEGLGTQLTNIKKWIQECAWRKPSLLILDNVDSVMSAEVEHSDSSTSLQLTEYFVSQLQKVWSQHGSNLSVIVTASSRDSLNKLLFSYHILENTFNLTAPDKRMRLLLLETYLKDKLSCSIQCDIMDIVSETEGYLPNDLKTLCHRIYTESVFNKEENSGELFVTSNVVKNAIKDFTPSNLRGVKLQKSSVNWSDIGGLKEAKSLLLETLEWPTKYAPIFSKCPLRLRSGILLYGYPGCGKTLLASAVAGQSGLNFISIKGPEILNKYIGASEQSVRELFERAQAAKPCILFFDEFDSIAPKRGHDSTGVTDRVVNQMLTQMDGAEGLDGVYVLAATSRPDLIDSALLRPGRLDKSVICDMPDHENRLDILQSVTGKMSLKSDVDLSEVADKSSGFSGADLQGLAYNAYLKAVHQKLTEDEEIAQKGNQSNDKVSYDFFQVSSVRLKNSRLKPSDKVRILHQIERLFEDDKGQRNTGNIDEKNTSTVISISHEDFLQSLEETKPSISVTEKMKLQRVYKEFVAERDGNMPDGTASNDIGGRTSLM